MKRYGYLYEQIISIDNLYLSSKKAAKGKSQYSDIGKWNDNLRQNILQLLFKYYISGHGIVVRGSKLHKAIERKIKELKS